MSDSENIRRRNKKGKKRQGRGRGRGRGKRNPAPLRAARMGAVQALYQMEQAGTGLDHVIGEFLEHRLGPGAPHASADQDCATMEHDTVTPGQAGSSHSSATGEPTTADPVFFERLIRGVVRNQRHIDPALDTHLAQDWRLPRIDSTMRAILRSAAFELMRLDERPTAVIINEYVNITMAFLTDREAGMVNAVLDALARQVRPGKMEKTGRHGPSGDGDNGSDDDGKNADLGGEDADGNNADG